MKILSCQATNFASYKNLEFQFSDKGLTLVHGPTGAGKSTLCDIIPWTLFGKTAKGGSVDEILAWGATAPTTATVSVLIHDRLTQVTRIRGGKANDLYFTIEGEEQVRGKDITDTQRLLNQKLGFDYETYLAGAYLHEFSQTAAFFTTTAKVRRAICEQIVDLSLAKRLQASVADNKRNQTIELGKIESTLRRAETSIHYYETAVAGETKRESQWNIETENERLSLLFANSNFSELQKLKISELQHKLDKVEAITAGPSILSLKAQLKKLSDKCEHCGSFKASESREKILVKIHANQDALKRMEYLQDSIDKELSAQNTYEDQLSALKLKKNPHAEARYEYQLLLQNENRNELIISNQLKTTASELNDLEALGDVLTTFRGELIKNTVSFIEHNTNDLLTRHFDGEIRVSFSVDTADKLEVLITKDGNDCVYSQLSKGQRQLLKLCFGVSVMKSVANHHGVDFSSIFLDEALDGFSETLKVKAIGLLEELSLTYSSVFVVDHSESLKAMINNRLEVELVDGSSSIKAL